MQCDIEYSDIFQDIDSEVKATLKPSIPNITLRDYQLDIIKNALQERRGTLIATTGLGKTMMALGIISCFPSSKSLFLTPTREIMYQTIEVFKKHGFNDISQIGDGIKDVNGRISVSTYQSFRTLDPLIVGPMFDIIVVDEAHIAFEKNSSYEKILSKMVAPVRIGMTATPPTDRHTSLLLEGLVGPVIGEITWSEGAELKNLADPYLELVTLPQLSSDVFYHNYEDAYRRGIVENKTRNRLAIENAINLSKHGKTSIIFISVIDHGKILYEMAQKAGLACEFVWGNTDSNSRKDAKQALYDKDLDCVIASVVWTLGLDIPTLDAVILAAGGKSEKRLLQSIGRSLRRTSGKEEATIIDFLDRGKYLADHAIERLSVFRDLGLL